MKKIVLAAIAVMGFSFANAQDSGSFGFSKGNILVEGNLGLSSKNDKNTETKTNFFEFNPKAGYFLTDKFALGLDLGVGSYKEKTAGSDADKSSIFKAGIFGRYYFLDLGQRFKTYAEAGVGLDSGKDSGAKYSGVGFNAGLGINYFVSNNFAINFGLTDILAFDSYKYKGGKAVSEFDANVNVFNNFFNTAKFGLTYKF
ncbi:outer membrane beta-barrel protein [Flavobacterium sharifuzzamanii]|uniref:outer membrane beta-barrel protein n=1 Tax=Flavobacterium sharifuzzamanii TaxID=2211133 RepID=UPI000DAB7E4F|nr:outer membrane beta-barrel protein [Flavobacterium sharifuzzamanii]KAF2081341.1 porin family protein [Flavobacterium sharifuzzamanii]